MPVTEFQREVCALIAGNRISSGESYVAGGLALNDILGAPRYSKDIDVFHDAIEALAWSVTTDSDVLEKAGMLVSRRVRSEFFAEAVVRRGSDYVDIQWVQDSAFRYFPLQTHPDFGLTLHPFDLATNKVLALVGRQTVRDWIDTVECCNRLQPLGYLAWSASGKDIGLNPVFILGEAARTTHYSQPEVDEEKFDGPKPNCSEIAVRWRQMLREAEEIVDILPADHVGACVLDLDGNLLQANPAELKDLLAADKVRYHEGCLRGAYPVIKSRS